MSDNAMVIHKKKKEIQNCYIFKFKSFFFLQKADYSKRSTVALSW